MIYDALKVLALISAPAVLAAGPTGSTCQELKDAYQGSACCNSNLTQTTSYHVDTSAKKTVLATHGAGMNICHGKKPVGAAWDNFACLLNGTVQAFEQSGANVTVGYQGQLGTNHTPITSSYFSAGLCPVNVHWHLGAEHYSAGEFDEFGSSPTTPVGTAGTETYTAGRRLAAAPVRAGFQCRHYNELDHRFTTEYNWKYCTNTKVGETYEVHWPHSAAGMCGTPNQFQSPFYDGVFCNDAAVALVLAGALPTSAAIGVQAQVFTIVNDENYYYPDLMRGAIQEGDRWSDVAKYTGSTTGTSRDNTVCSQYGPLTWQVDRKCHLISASSFDKMCKDMLTQRDDMSSDTHPHGSRALVADELAANNLQRL